MRTVKIRAALSAFSAAGFARGIDNMMDMLAVLISALMRNVGILALLVADAVAGGIVINDTLSHGRMWVTVLAACWSIATGAILMSLWEAAFRGGLRKAQLIPLLFAVAVTLVDAYIDIKIVTLLMYPELDVMPGLMPPNASPMWLPLTILCGLLTTCGELGIVFIRARRKEALAAEAALARDHDAAIEITRPVVSSAS